MLLNIIPVFSTYYLVIVVGEWVELPQFSDSEKVYKLPASDGDFLYQKFRNDDHEATSSRDEIIFPGNNENSWRFDGTEAYNWSEQCEEVDGMEKKDITTTKSVETLNIPVIEPPTTEMPKLHTPAPKFEPIEDAEYRNRSTEYSKFEDYLPMEILSKVHRTLKSQPKTAEGKVRFFQRFERSLTSEIEFRLSEALAPRRRRRGAHDYYDHDDQVGFPSLEGALMAISFLTFAVYLVRLVMLLFQNTNTTTTTATILNGRRKRTIDDRFNAKTVKILHLLDSYDPN